MCARGPIAGDLELENGGVVYNPIYGSRRGHRVFEDLLPFAEYEVAGNNDGAAFVTLGQESEEHLDLLSALLGVSDVIKNKDFEVIQFAQFPGEIQVSFGGQQILPTPRAQ